MPLVGRERELRTLERALAGAAAGEGQMMVLSGEPGVGKTKLLRELGLRAENRGFSVLHLRCLPYDLLNEELVWHSIWRRLSESSASERHASPCTSASQHFDNDLDLILNGKTNSDPDQGAPESQSVAALFHQFLDLFEHLSRNCPLLIALDDIHYADESSLRLLKCLSQSLDALPLLFALSCSPAQLAGRPEANCVIQVIIARGHLMEIGPLDDDATRHLLQDVTGLAPEERIVQSVHHLTGGNPRFILECDSVVGDLNRALLRERAGSTVRIPGAVRLAINERLKSLSPEARKILEVASLSPKTFDPQTTSMVVDFDEAETLAAIAELLSKGLILPATDHAYEYAHGFTRELLYRELSISQRAYLHRRIATVLEADGPSHSVNAPQIAEHLMDSGEPRMTERAVRYARCAAARFANVCDFAKAAEMYSLAAAAIESRATPDPGELCTMLTALGETQVEAGQIEQAQQTFCRAATLAQRLADNERLVQIVLRMPVPGWPFAGSPNAVALTLAEQSLVSLPEGDSVERSLLMARIALELAYLKDQGSRSEALFAEAFEMGQRLGDRGEGAILRICQLRDHILRRPDRTGQRLANADQAIPIARKTRDNDALFACALAKLGALSEMGDIASAQGQFALLQEAAALAKRPAYRVVLLNLKAARALHQGRLDLSDELSRDAQELAKANGLESLADRCWPGLIVPMREQGRMMELVPLANRTCEAPSSSYAPRALLCWLAFELGDTIQARSILDHLALEDFAELTKAPSSLAIASLLAEVCAGLQIRDYAAVLYDFLLPFRQRYVVLEPAFTAFGSVSRYLGKLAAALAHYDQAVAHCEDAVELDRKAGGRTWAAYSAVELANCLLARARPGDRQRAAMLARMAGTEATTLKLRQLEKDIAELTGGDAGGAACLHAGSHIPAHADSGALAPLDNPLRDTFGRTCSSVSPRPCARLRHEAGFWELTFEESTVRLKHLRGLMLTAYLLARPNQAVQTLELASLGNPGEAVAEGCPSSDLGPALDSEAKRAYRARIRELQAELEDARASGNESSVREAEEELRFLERELSRAVGLFGRNRRMGSDAERARVRVTNSIKFAIAKVSKHQPSLGSYLERTIRTGTSCCYIPEPNAEIVWEL